jgi:hypothetical protein
VREQAFGPPKCQRWTSRELVSERFCLLLYLVIRYDSSDNAPLIGLLGRECAIRQGEFKRAFQTDQVWEYPGERAVRSNSLPVSHLRQFARQDRDALCLNFDLCVGCPLRLSARSL